MSSLQRSTSDSKSLFDHDGDAIMTDGQSSSIFQQQPFGTPSRPLYHHNGPEPPRASYLTSQAPIPSSPRVSDPLSHRTSLASTGPFTVSGTTSLFHQPRHLPSPITTRYAPGSLNYHSLDANYFPRLQVPAPTRNPLNVHQVPLTFPNQSDWVYQRNRTGPGPSTQLPRLSSVIPASAITGEDKHSLPPPIPSTQHHHDRTGRGELTPPFPFGPGTKYSNNLLEKGSRGEDQSLSHPALPNFHPSIHHQANRSRWSPRRENTIPHIPSRADFPWRNMASQTLAPPVNHQPRHRRRPTRPPRPPRPLIPKGSCTACMETFQLDKLLDMSCPCKYCVTCLNEVFRAGCTSIGAFPPKCCGKPIRISQYGGILKPDVLKRYKEVEAEFSAKRPLYCAMPKCSTFIPESNLLPQHQVGVCPNPACSSSTCALCKRLMEQHTIWEVENRVCPPTDENTVKLFELGTDKKWKQCPSCRVMVERIDGCNHMVCVCGVEFCYRCGELFNEDDLCACDSDEDENDSDEEHQTDSEEEGQQRRPPQQHRQHHEWPNHRAAVDRLGGIVCMHWNTRELEDVQGFCHGCLRVKDELKSCVDCGVEICEECLEDVHDPSEDDAEDEEEEEEQEE